MQIKIYNRSFVQPRQTDAILADMRAMIVAFVAHPRLNELQVGAHKKVHKIDLRQLLHDYDVQLERDRREGMKEQVWRVRQVGHTDRHYDLRASDLWGIMITKRMGCGLH